MPGPLHHLQTNADGIHPAHNWVYANSAARTGATGFISSDVYKIALQTDNNSLWLLTTITPTWVAISGLATSTTFLSLTDTPSSYSGQANQLVGVNSGASALEFKNPNLHSVTDALTNGFTNVVTLAHNSSGTPAAGFGTGIGFQAETSTTDDTLIGGINYVWRSAVHASRLSQVNLIAYSVANALSVGRIAASVSSITSPNAIGDGAVDLQPHKTNANQVAAGAYSFLGGGNANLIESGAEGSAIVGGATNSITGSSYNGFIGGGNDNTILSPVTNGFIGGGDTNVVQVLGTNGGIVGGLQNGVSAARGFVGGGRQNTVQATNGVAFGAYARVDHQSTIALSGGTFGAVGDARTIIAPLMREITHSDANWYELFINGATATLLIPTNTVWTFDILIVGSTAGAAKTFSFRIEGAIENDGGTTTLLASTVTTIYDADDVSFDARVRGDDTNDGLAVEVMDADSGGDVVRWVATVKIVSVTSS